MTRDGPPEGRNHPADRRLGRLPEQPTGQTLSGYRVWRPSRRRRPARRPRRPIPPGRAGSRVVRRWNSILTPPSRLTATTPGPVAGAGCATRPRAGAVGVSPVVHQVEVPRPAGFRLGDDRLRLRPVGQQDGMDGHLGLEGSHAVPQRRIRQPDTRRQPPRSADPHGWSPIGSQPHRCPRCDSLVRHGASA